MWKPFEDYQSGKLFNLYYYNLCYDVPLYLHIDLCSDSEHGVVFWYMASTIRHFGIGNYTRLSEERKTFYRNNMAIYKKYKAYFANGEFYGDGPCIHYHKLEKQGVLALFFNDSDQEKTLRSDVCAHVPGLSSNWTASAVSGTMEKKDSLCCTLPPYGVGICYIQEGQ